MKSLKSLTIALVIAGFGLAQAGCIGPFNLTKKLYNWNNNLGDKYVNAVIFFSFATYLPIYGLTLAGDAVIFNTIEFWTGNNPIAMAEGESNTEYVTSNDKTFKVVTSKNAINVTEVGDSEESIAYTMLFNQENRTWSYESENHSFDFIQIDETTDGKISYNILNPDGDIVNTLDDEADLRTATLSMMK